MSGVDGEGRGDGEQGGGVGLALGGVAAGDDEAEAPGGAQGVEGGEGHGAVLVGADGQGQRGEGVEGLEHPREPAGVVGGVELVVGQEGGQHGVDGGVELAEAAGAGAEHAGALAHEAGDGVVGQRRPARGPERVVAGGGDVEPRVDEGAVEIEGDRERRLQKRPPIEKPA